MREDDMECQTTILSTFEEGRPLRLSTLVNVTQKGLLISTRASRSATATGGRKRRRRRRRGRNRALASTAYALFRALLASSTAKADSGDRLRDSFA